MNQGTTEVREAGRLATGEPTSFYDRGGIRIYIDDCRRLIRSIPADAVITDPVWGNRSRRACLKAQTTPRGCWLTP